MTDKPTYDELESIRKSLEERVQSLEILQDTGLFGELFRKADDLIIIATTDGSGIPGRILLANPAALIRLEYSLEEIQKLSFNNLMGSSHSKVIKMGLSPESHKYETTIFKKSGGKIHSDIYSHMFLHGKEKLAFAIVRDIGDRLEMEESIHRNEEKYKRLVESLNDEYIFYAHDTSGMITYISPSIEKVLGYSQDEAMRNFREFLTDHEMNEESLRYSKESLKGNIQPSFRNELYHRDGSTRIFYNTELPIYDEKGKITGVEGIAHDITNRFAAEKELQKQEEILRLLVETIESVFWITDLKKTELLFISPKYKKVYGRSTDSLYHNPGSFLKVVHPDDIEYVKKAYKRISKGEDIDIEYRIIAPEGDEKLIWSRSFVLFDDRKRPSLSVGSAQDITERNKSQQDKKLLAAIVENVEDHAVIKDINLKVIASNPANTRAAGKKSANELIGKTDLENFGDLDHVRQYMEDDRKALKLKKGQTLVSDQFYVFPDGKKIHSLVKKFPIYDEKNKLIAVASISRDITDFKNILKDLYESEEKYRLLFENQGEGIGMVNEKDIFLFANPKADEIFGVPNGKLKGRSVFDFVDKANRQLIHEQTERRSKGEKDTYELDILRPDGEKKKILVTATPQYADEGFKGTFAVFRDITDWRITEENLKKSEQELREVNAAKDKFFSIIAHDLRNPFNSILGFSQLLLKDYSDYDKEEVLTFISMINDSAKQAHNLLENLLNWSMAQTGKMIMEPSGIDLLKIISSILDLYEGSFTEKNIKLLNQILPGTMVYGDSNMIHTIFRNLFSNAIKFTRPGGEIKVSSEKHGACIDILISDNGIGIPEDLLEKLFLINENKPRSGTANEEGTGLGLVLCKEFLEKNNGSLKVKSKEGKGSTFIVRLPRPGKYKPSNPQA